MGIPCILRIWEEYPMEDTIAAVATAYGEGGIGIIRISGENALPILQEVFEQHN